MSGAGLAHGLDGRVEGGRGACRRPERERGGRDGLDGAEAVRLDAGDLDEAAHGVAGHAEMVLERDLGGVLDLLGRAAQDGARPAAAMAAAEPTSAWQPASAPEMRRCT
jgi:hypothetical protein